MISTNFIIVVIHTLCQKGFIKSRKNEFYSKSQAKMRYSILLIVILFPITILFAQNNESNLDNVPFKDVAMKVWIFNIWIYLRFFIIIKYLII